MAGVERGMATVAYLANVFSAKINPDMSQPEPKFQPGEHVYYKGYLYKIEVIAPQPSGEDYYILMGAHPWNTFTDFVSVTRGNEYFLKA